MGGGGREGGRSLADIALLPPLVPAFSRWELHREVDIREVSCGALVYSLQVGTSKTLQDCCRIWSIDDICEEMVWNIGLIRIDDFFYFFLSSFFPSLLMVIIWSWTH